MGENSVWHAIFEQCGAALLLLDLGTRETLADADSVRVVDANRAAALLFGADGVGGLRGPLSRLIPGANDWLVEDVFARDRLPEVRVRSLRGRALVLQATLEHLPGEHALALLTLDDCTATHAQIERLTHQAHAHTELQRLAGVGVMELTLPEGRLEWSETMVDILGLPPGTSGSYERWLLAVHPDDRTTATEAFETLLGGGSQLGFPLRVRRPDGVVRQIQVEARASHADSRPERITCTVQDITDRLPAAESGGALWPLLDHALQEMYLCDTDSLQIIQASRAARRLAGADMQRCSLADLLPPSATERLRGIVDDLRQGFLEEALFETELPAVGGGVRPVELRISRAGGARPSVLLAIAQDISERRRLEAARDELLASISHELRTPLTALHGALTLVSGGVGGIITTPATAEMVAIAQRNAARLLRLVEDLLDLHKAEAGALPVECRPIELMPVVEQAITLHEGSAKSRDVSLVLARSIPGKRVHADGERLGQVLDNLIANALRFAPAGTEVVVAVTDHVQYARVLVADSGPGVPPSLRERLFRRLARGSGPDRGGSGLGLAISRVLMERMGGEIGCLDPPGGGACFFVELPISGEPPGGF